MEDEGFLECFEHHSGSLESLELKAMLPSVASVFSCSSKQPICVTYLMGSMSINIHHTHSCQAFLIIKELVLITSCLSVQDVKWPNPVSSPFWTSSLIWQHNVQMQCVHVCAMTQPAQHACVCICVCQMAQEGRGVQYLKPGFMAVDIPILTCKHAVNPIAHPKCLQWTGLGAYIHMGTTKSRNGEMRN